MTDLLEQLFHLSLWCSGTPLIIYSDIASSMIGFQCLARSDEHHKAEKRMERRHLGMGKAHGPGNGR